MPLVIYTGNIDLTNLGKSILKKSTDLTEKAMGADPANIMNGVIIFLFIKTFTIVISINV